MLIKLPYDPAVFFATYILEEMNNQKAGTEIFIIELVTIAASRKSVKMFICGLMLNILLHMHNMKRKC